MVSISTNRPKAPDADPHQSTERLFPIREVRPVVGEAGLKDQTGEPGENSLFVEKTMISLHALGAEVDKPNGTNFAMPLVVERYNLPPRLSVLWRGVREMLS
ncbi:MAG: hypothetical protein DMG10_20215 [Acidobacteria bacterium]|nr:MAG: hypothetical protein DMG10_20215 [Acidobacteriota bacterium]